MSANWCWCRLLPKLRQSSWLSSEQTSVCESARARVVTWINDVASVPHSLSDVKLTQKMLSAKGANVTMAENGQIALDAFQTHVMTQAFDVVITDLMMPELDGHGLVKAIRKSDTQIPVIAVTAAVIGQETDQLMAEGATAVLSKPIKVDELTEVLRRKQTQPLASTSS